MGSLHLIIGRARSGEQGMPNDVGSSAGGPALKWGIHRIGIAPTARGLKLSAGLFNLSSGDFHGHLGPATGRLGVPEGPDPHR
jgi:hypothetical protein